MTFNAVVDITGSPQLELDFNGTAKAAACATGTNTTTMVCSYTVPVGDSAPNGIAIAANKLTGGTIYATGSTTTNADLDHAAVPIDAGHKVDGIRPTLVTTGTDAPKTSPDGTQVILTFSETISSFDVNGTTIAVDGATTYQQGATVSLSGRTVTLTLVSPTPTIVSGQTVTVALAFGAVRDAAGNRNLAVAATAVTNVVGTATQGAPDVPQSLSATRGNRQVMLSWVLPSGGSEVTHYEYEQDLSGTWTSTGGTATRYTVTGLTNDQTYRFRVRAVNGAGASAASSSRSATPTATATTPPPPNAAPVFPSAAVTLSFAEHVGDAAIDAAVDIGAPITATDDDNNTLTYTLEGAGQGSLYHQRHRPAPDEGRRDLRLRGAGLLHGDGEGRRRQERHGHDHGDHHAHQRQRPARHSQTRPPRGAWPRTRPRASPSAPP